MSWPQWPTAQPSVAPVLPVQATAAPVINSAPAVAPPGLQYTPEQWAQVQQQNWHQWAQWQQQYQQWHQQYGAEYQKSMNALAAQSQVPVPALPNMAVPPPLPIEPKPPLPEEPPPAYSSAPGYNTSAPAPPPPQPPNQSYNTKTAIGDRRPPVMYQKPPPNWPQNYQNKRSYDQPEPEANKRQMVSKPDWNRQAPPQKRESLEELTEAEKKFDKQFADWEAQFNKWKEQNAEHPDKEQYREYEKKWESWRNQLLDRREQMKRKRIAMIESSNKNRNFNSPQNSFNQPPPNFSHAPKPGAAAPFATLSNKPPPTLNDEPLVFKNRSEPHMEENVGDFIKPNTDGGIPGLDLVRDEPFKGKDEDVVLVDPDKEEKERKGPDLEAISKGINSILGDQKILNMLSLVSQNQMPKPDDNLTNTISKISEHDSGQYYEQSNQSNEEHSNHSANFGQREVINNFDDQTRSSFTTHHDQETRMDHGGFRNQFGLKGEDKFGPGFGAGRDRFAPGPGFGDNRFGPGNRFAPGEGEDRFPPGPGGDRFGPGPGGSRFGSGPAGDKFAPGKGEDRFPSGPRGDKFAPGKGEDRFAPGSDKFVGNRFGPGPGGDKFAPGPGGNRFGSRPGGDRFAFEQVDNFGVSPGSNKFGGDEFASGPGGDKFGARPGGDRFDSGSGGDRFDSGPRDDKFGPRPTGGRFGSGPDDRYEPDARRGRFGDNYDSQQEDWGSNKKFGQMQNKGPRFDNEDRYRFGNQNKFGPNKYPPENDRFGQNPKGSFGGNNKFGPQDNVGDYNGDEDYNQDYNNEGYEENYDEYDYDGIAASFEHEPNPNMPREPPKDEWSVPNYHPPEIKEKKPRMEVEEPEDIFEPAQVIDYEHKSSKPSEPEVLVEPIYMFDYRHKSLNRIPLPQRPKWLTDSVKNIREFDPPLVRPYETQNLRRYPGENWRGERYPVQEKWPYGRRGYEERRPYEEPRGRNDWKKNTHDEKYYEKSNPPPLDCGEEKISDTEWPEDDDFEETVPVNFQKTEAPKKNVVLIEDILNPPGRFKRPPRVVIILRGPPGSGKTFLAKLIKDREVENGGSAPRILSLDDYFMVEQEKEVTEDGKKVKVKEMVYEYEEEMEESYRLSLVKSFKKTITDGYFSFIIVDNVNDKVKYFGEMWSFAKQNGFQVYICQLDLDVQTCSKRNIHGRSEEDIEKCVSNWEATPSHHPTLDATSLLQSGSIREVEMEEVNSPESDANAIEGLEDQVSRSKWDNFDCSVVNLAKLDGVSKPLRHKTMEEYLQLDSEWTPIKPTKPGQKRVRWADLEEQKQQEKMRAIGFVVGHTNWNRMMDPTGGSSALTQTKYIERTGRHKVDHRRND